MQIKMREICGVEVVEMSGAIDALVFSDLSVALTRMIHELTPCIVLDCSHVSYIGSAQLKELLDFASLARARGGDIKCVGVSPTIQQVANLIAMGDLLEFYDKVADALPAFRGPVAAGAAR